EQSVRIVEKLEKDGEGLNLTEEVIDGIRNHQTEGTPHTLEGQVVRLADKIAYVSADVDDAIRAHLISEEDIPEDIREVLGTNVKKRLNTLIHDVITESLDSPVIRMSQERIAAMFKLREFLFLSVYKNPEAKGEEVKAKRMIEELFHYFMENFEAVPEKFRRIGQSLNDPKDRVVCDYISGMTDDFATQKFAEYFIPRSWEAELD
ncbi:MAG: deoxyguanosinetriphosphate triphosphohydrolase, partial [Lachnospiraceae bacterium]|nr:deoxyguanosinetriphosphate triphosphohydrolase [Lachnospiraceae bacterium]